MLVAGCGRFTAAVALTAAFFNPGISRADQSGTGSLKPYSSLDLETGMASGTSGDVLWDGRALIPQGSAELYNLGKYGARIFHSIKARAAASVAYSPSPIPAGELAAGDVFGVHTRAGHYAKVLVTAVDENSLSLEFTTFAPAAAPHPAAASGPLITSVQNNYSSVLAGQPNYGIAPGSIFAIYGAGLSTAAPPVLQSSAPPGLPTTLNQTKVSVTVKGVTVNPGLYFTTATQIAAVLPSTTPVGSGTLTVTFNGQTSAPAPFQVVSGAVGLDTFDSSGNGLAAATDINGKLVGPVNSVAPGQTLVLWGSGIGADPANDDLTYPQKIDNLSNIPLQIFIGGVPATIQYQGRSVFPGLDQYNVLVPSNVPPGCFVSLVAQVGNIVSNAVTVSVNPGGGVCTDPATGLNGTQIQSLAGKAAANLLTTLLSVHPGGSNSLAFGIGGPLPGGTFGKGYEYVSEGSCTIVPPEQSFINPLPSKPFDFGNLQLTGPNGTVNVPSVGGSIYQTSLTAPPGMYTFSGSGGANAGPFQASFNVTAPSFTITNLNSLSTVTRSQGLTVNWTGGFANGVVQINGSAGAPAVKFFCYAPTSAGQVTVPPSILLAMPPGGGYIAVLNSSPGSAINASGLDIGMAAGVYQSNKVSTVYK